MSYIDYFHFCYTFLITKTSLMHSSFWKHGKNFDTCQDPDKVIFNFSSCNLNGHGKSVLCKGLNFAIPPKPV